jgi:hypothetical protein
MPMFGRLFHRHLQEMWRIGQALTSSASTIRSGREQSRLGRFCATTWRRILAPTGRIVMKFINPEFATPMPDELDAKAIFQQLQPKALPKPRARRPSVPRHLSHSDWEPGCN